MSLNVDINKTEKIILSVCAIALLVFFTANVTWVLEQFGIQIGTATINSIVEYVANGGTLVSAFATIAGITLPAWVGAAVTAFGVTAA